MKIDYAYNAAGAVGRTTRLFLNNLSSIYALITATCYWIFVAPFETIGRKSAPQHHAQGFNNLFGPPHDIIECL